MKLKNLVIDVNTKRLSEKENLEIGKDDEALELFRRRANYKMAKSMYDASHHYVW